MGVRDAWRAADVAEVDVRVYRVEYMVCMMRGGGAGVGVVLFESCCGIVGEIELGGVGSVLPALAAGRGALVPRRLVKASGWL